MDIRVQFTIAMLSALAISIPVAIFMLKKAKKEGTSVKYLQIKLLVLIILPITSIPILLANKMSLLSKIGTIFAMLMAMIVHFYIIKSQRKTFRNIIGLPPEDEHTGEVIEETKKNK